MAFVYKLGCSGSGTGFFPDETWIKEQTLAGNLCRECKSIIDHRASRITSIVAGDMPERDPLGLFNCLKGGVVLSQTLITHIGRRRILKYHWIVPIVDRDRGLTEYRYVGEKRESGTTRGSSRPILTYCSGCGRLYYWPVDTRYLLSRYWPAGAIFSTMSLEAFVSPDFYERRIRPLRLKRLTATKIRLVDEPEDGYPANFEALKRAVKLGRRFNRHLSE